mmetsp:Transcript_25990/g.60857  ORF Transcript_25990/g.60857 Transcript_25990/m.60857 type:complete len:84 (+) Transcript_25990:504-755(+)
MLRSLPSRLRRQRHLRQLSLQYQDRQDLQDQGSDQNLALGPERCPLSRAPRRATTVGFSPRVWAREMASSMRKLKPAAPKASG